MRTLHWLLLCAITAVMVGGCGPKKFETASLNSEDALQQQAGNFWKKDGWWSLPKTSKTVAITEFSVEYVTRTGTQAQGLGLIAIAQMAGMGKSEYRFDENMKRQLATDLYAMYVQALAQRGYTVVPTETLTATAGYKKLQGLAEGDETKHAETSGISFRQTQYQYGQVYAAPGLVAVDQGFFASFSNPGNEMNAIGQSGADTGLRVRIKVGIDDEGRATLYAGSTIAIKADVQKNESPLTGTTYWAKTAGNVTSTQSLYFSEAVIDAKDFEAFKGDVYDVQAGPFSAAVKNVYPQFAAMSVYAMKK